MNSTIQETIQQFLQFMSERNLTALTNLFSDTVDWYIPGDEQKAPWLGVRNNKQEISDFLNCYGKIRNLFLQKLIIFSTMMKML
ncbi:hypothetical protein [Chryseobacterium sp. 7]|uniref:hypothetical protein n=1 Tax=Chryseobacterium sp. 7 TaxID=2035214 RepID=UPI000EAC27B3|nr:hypothetical protein [Chryseobacterium sp. 7]